MLPLHKLAARILGEGVAIVAPLLLLWFFGVPVIGLVFMILAAPTVVRLVDDIFMFKFVYENAHGIRDTKEQDEPSEFKT